jgi:hypothetical protein
VHISRSGKPTNEAAQFVQLYLQREAVTFQPLTFTNKRTGLPIVNPTDLTGPQLVNSVISSNQFLSLWNLTPQGLADTGGSVSNISASLIASQATALANARCDVDQDGTTTVSDIQLITNEVIGLAPVVNDLNHDGLINVVDVQITINAVLGHGCSGS